jgi:hypothetical protein
VSVFVEHKRRSATLVDWYAHLIRALMSQRKEVTAMHSQPRLRRIYVLYAWWLLVLVRVISGEDIGLALFAGLFGSLAYFGLWFVTRPRFHDWIDWIYERAARPGRAWIDWMNKGNDWMNKRNDEPRSSNAPPLPDGTPASPQQKTFGGGP